MDHRERKKIRYEERSKEFKEEFAKRKQGPCHECKRKCKLIPKQKEGVHILSDYAYWCSRGVEEYKRRLAEARWECYLCAKKKVEKREETNARALFTSFRYCQHCYGTHGVTFSLKEGQTSPLTPLSRFDFWSSKSKEEYTRELDKFLVLCKPCREKKGKEDPKIAIKDKMKEVKYCQCGDCFPQKVLTEENLYVKTGKKPIQAYFGSALFGEILKKSLFFTKSCFEAERKKIFELKQATNVLSQSNLAQTQREEAEEVIQKYKTVETNWLDEGDSRELSGDSSRGGYSDSDFLRSVS